MYRTVIQPAMERIYAMDKNEKYDKPREFVNILNINTGIVGGVIDSITLMDIRSFNYFTYNVIQQSITKYENFVKDFILDAINPIFTA